MEDPDRPIGAGPARKVPAHPPRRLRVHLLGFALALLLPALLGGGLTAWQLGQAYRHAAQAGLQSAARAMAAATDRELNVVATAAATLAASPSLRGALSAAGVEDAALPELYAQLRAVGEAFGGWMVLARPDGTQLLNTQFPLGTPLPRARGVPWIAGALATEQVAMSDLFTGSGAPRQVLAAFAPVSGLGAASGSQLVLVLVFDPGRLARLLSEASQENIAGLIDTTTGLYVARSPGHAEAIGRPAPAWLGEAVPKGKVGLARGLSLEGTDVVAAYQRLERVPWAAVVTLPASAYDQAWYRPLFVLLAAGVALLAAALLLAGILARRLLRPVRALARDAEAMARGLPLPRRASFAPVAEFEALRAALSRAAEGMRARAAAEGRAAAAEEAALALRTERDRARLYFEVAGAMLVVLDAEGRVRGINRRGLKVLGLPDEAAALGRDWFDSFLPERLRIPLRRAFKVIVEDHPILPEDHENAVLRADGEERLIAWRTTPLRDASGQLLAVVASGEDITDRRAAERQQGLLMRELDHRAKNVLAVVQSIVRLTQAERPADFAAAIDGRVRALGRAHMLLAQESWAGSDLRAVVEAELSPYVAGGRATLAGPEVRLAPEAVQPLAMILHELVTNAAKHGALSAPGGRVEVGWATLPEGGLRLTWTESGGPPVQRGALPRRGFGSRLIAATAPQLGGAVSFDWQPAGLRCRLSIAADRVAVRQGVVRASRAPEAAEETAPPTNAPPLQGRRILVAEDETVVAMEVEGVLHALGCTVLGPAATLPEALRLAEEGLRQGGLDAAVLDVNLNGQAAFPVADLLVRQGLPVLFTTGYHELPGGWAMGGGQGRTARLHKPLARGALAAALQRLLAGSDGSPDLPRRAAPGGHRRAQGGQPPHSRR